MDRDRLLTLAAVLVLIGAAIYYLEGRTPQATREAQVVELASDRGASSAEKERRHPRAKEIVQPSGFVNVENLHLADLIGKQIILVDFWTYSCINCQRTQPYLNAWQEKYGDKGLMIVGVHTPEFEFEKDIANVQMAVAQAGIRCPVVLDNDYATWQAYGNRYWPRKYLIDIDGYIVYDHIGEGAYEETEQKIQELLQERAERLQTNQLINQEISRPAAISRSEGVNSPEVYFGANRNEFLGNGAARQRGTQSFAAPADTPLNQLFLDGQWDIQPEYATNLTAPAKIRFRYQAKEVYMVASAEEPVKVAITQDCQPVGQITIKADQLYTLMSNPAAGEHTLELVAESPGLKAFTFTFG